MTTFRINILELNEHTSAILQLLRTEKLIEIIEEEVTIPEWQKNVVRDRIKNTNKEEYLSQEEFENGLNPNA
jgi:hypothetical protein